MDKVVHFDIPVDNASRAKKFYAIFGWQMEDYPGMDYIGIRTVPVDDKQMPTERGAINGGMMKRTPEVRGPAIAVEVRSVDKYIEKAVAAGGKVVMPKKEIGEHGYYAYVSDTEGNVLGLWEPIHKAK